MAKARRAVQNRVSVCVVAIFLATPLWPRSPLQKLQPFVTTCGTDGEISTKDRSAVDQIAMEFMQSALGSNPENAYSAFTADAKGNVPLEKFVAMTKQGIQRMAPFKDLHVAHTYLAKVTGGNEAQSVICGNLSSTENWVAVSVKPGPAQAYVILEAQTVNNTWAFVLWLLPEQEKWRVQYFQIAGSEIVGKSAGDFLRMAEAEQQKKHGFNAFILYATALQLAQRGPFLQLGIQQDIQQGLQDISLPDDAPRPPSDWHLGSSTFKILNVGPIGVGQKVYLQVDQEIEPWSDDKVPDKINHELITAIAAAHPEYKDAFAGLVARAHERGGSRGFGTVSVNDSTVK